MYSERVPSTVWQLLSPPLSGVEIKYSSDVSCLRLHYNSWLQVIQPRLRSWFILGCLTIANIVCEMRTVIWQSSERGKCQKLTMSGEKCLRLFRESGNSPIIIMALWPKFRFVHSCIYHVIENNGRFVFIPLFLKHVRRKNSDVFCFNLQCLMPSQTHEGYGCSIRPSITVHFIIQAVPLLRTR